MRQAVETYLHWLQELPWIDATVTWWQATGVYWAGGFLIVAFVWNTTQSIVDHNMKRRDMESRERAHRLSRPLRI